MTKKPSLAGLGKPTEAPAAAAGDDQGKTKRGAGKRVSIPFRVSPENWSKLINYAASKHMSMNQLMFEAIQAMRHEDGLPKLDDN